MGLEHLSAIEEVSRKAPVCEVDRASPPSLRATAECSGSWIESIICLEMAREVLKL